MPLLSTTGAHHQRAAWHRLGRATPAALLHLTCRAPPTEQRRRVCGGHPSGAASGAAARRSPTPHRRRRPPPAGRAGSWLWNTENVFPAFVIGTGIKHPEQPGSNVVSSPAPEHDLSFRHSREVRGHSFCLHIRKTQSFKYSALPAGRCAGAGAAGWDTVTNPGKACAAAKYCQPFACRTHRHIPMHSARL